MPTRRGCRVVACVAALALACAAIAPPAGAQTVLTWDPNGATEGVGGSGTWNTTDLSWVGGSGTVAWPGTLRNTAVFAGTSGTVTVLANGGPVDYWVGLPVRNTMWFTTDGYMLSGTGRIAMSNSNADATLLNTIRVDGGATVRFATNFYAYGGIVKSGAGTMVISNSQRAWRFGNDNPPNPTYKNSSFEGLTILESGSVYARGGGNGNMLGVGGTNGGSFIRVFSRICGSQRVLNTLRHDPQEVRVTASSWPSAVGPPCIEA